MPETNSDLQGVLWQALQPAVGVIARLSAAFESAGHELYLVGGSVRDALLGELGHDLDFTTDARPEQTLELLRPLTSAIWEVGKDFGTISALMSDDQAAAQRAAAPEQSDSTTGPANHAVRPAAWQVEITTFRSDAYSADSRKPEVQYGEHIGEDLIRRDFTVNAMAIDVTSPDPENWRFVDPLHGLADLEARLLRTPTAPQISFSDDPLRMMRVARFASQLQFQLAPDTAAALPQMAERIEIISAERVRDELNKLLLTDQPRAGLNVLVNSGIADRVLPELPAMRLETDEHMRHKDVYEHSLTVLDQAIALEKSRDLIDGKPNPDHQPDLILRLAALLHDIGKPRTRALDGGKVTFHHHDVVGAKMARKRLRALRYSNEVVDAVSQLIEQHLRFHGYAEGSSGGASSGWTDSAVRRYVRDAGDQLERLHILTRSDCTTRNQRKADRLRRAYDELEFRIDELAAQEELDAMRPDLNGDQIIDILGIKPGPTVGKAYKFLLDRRMDSGPLGEAQARAELLAWWAEQPENPEAKK